MNKTALVAFLSFLTAGVALGAWYDSPGVRASVERPATADPHYMNLSEDGRYLLLNLNAANNPARKTLVYRTDILAAARGASQPLHTIDQTLAGSKGGALSAKRGVMIPGFGTDVDIGYKAYSLDDRADAGTALASLTATGLVLDGLDFSADGSKIFSNSYKDGTRGNLVVLDATDLANIALVKTVATGLARIRSVNAYSVGGRDLVYFGEGGVEDGAAGKIAVYDAASGLVTVVVADAARLTADVMCVKLSGTKTSVPMMYVLLNDGRLFVYQLASDGTSVASTVPVKEFSPDQVAAFCGAAKTAKYRNFEVLDDASLAFFTTTGAAPLAVVGAAATDDEPYALFLGNQSIDTGCKFGPDTAVVADFAFTDVETTQQFVWEGSDYLQNVSRIYVNGSKGFSFAANDGTAGSWQTFDVALSTTRYVGIVDAYNNQARILDANGKVVKNQDAKIKAQTHVNTSTKTIRIASNATPNGNYAKMRLYGFKVYEKGVLVRDYVPARSHGDFGVRDLVTGEFATDYRIDAGEKYVMSGSETVPEDPSPYIESDGTSTMNTRFCVSADSRVEVDYAFVATNTLQVRVLGADGAGDGAMRIGLYINGSGYIAFGAGYKAFNGRHGSLKPGLGRHVAVFDFDNRRYEWRVGSSVRWSYSITDSEYDEYAVAAASPAPWPILIFGAATKATGFSSNNRSKCRIYGVKLYRAGVLKHDYAPCVKGGVPGFRDRVDGAFITGENVAAFTAGGDVEQIEDDAYVSTSGNDQDAAHGYNKFFSTGYVITDKTRVELDYALADNYKGVGSGNVDWYLFDAYCTNTVAGGAATRFNAGHNKQPQLFLCLAGMNWTYLPDWAGQTAGANIRRTIVVDNARKEAMLMTSGFTNGVVTVDKGDQTGLKSISHLCIAANNNKTSGFAPLKIYGCRIYEDGALQRNYVPQVRNAAPGLYDTVNATFLTPPWATSTNICAVGGAIYRDAPSQDAYLEFTRQQSIDTGVKIGLDYCTKADFAYTEVANKPNQQFVGEADGNFTLRLCYTSGSGGNNAGFSWTAGSNFTGIGQSANFQRYQSLIDLKNNKVRFYANGQEVYDGDSMCSAQTRSAATTRTLKIGSASSNTANNPAAMRFYGLKIWQGGENGKLIRDFVPYKSGNKVGLYDKVEGKVYEDTRKIAPLRVGGTAATLVVEPTDTEVGVDESATLKVLSPGAVSYQWYVNGVAIEGLTGETCRVDWRKGQPHVDVYSVVPVYDVDGKTVFGPASEAVVTYALRGLSILIR